MGDFTAALFSPENLLFISAMSSRHVIYGFVNIHWVPVQSYIEITVGLVDMTLDITVGPLPLKTKTAGHFHHKFHGFFSHSYFITNEVK